MFSVFPQILDLLPGSINSLLIEGCPAPAFQKQLPHLSNGAGAELGRPTLCLLQRHSSKADVPMRKRRLSWLEK